MHFFFGDDAKQRHPTRDGMGPIIAAGGILVPGKSVRSLENELDDACSLAGFPQHDEFKWSPGRELWMHRNLIGRDRAAFFLDVLHRARNHGVRCVVAISDTHRHPATGKVPYDQDVTTLLLERIHHRIPDDTDGCVVIVDRPTGGRTDEDAFLYNCLELIQSGTRYVKHDRIALNVLASPSRFVRLLQLADVVTSCTAARVSGEREYSPAVFAQLVPLFPEEYGRRGGVSIKLHPDFLYANLYHWLFGDEILVRSGGTVTLPLPHRSYAHSEYTK